VSAHASSKPSSRCHPTFRFAVVQNEHDPKETDAVGRLKLLSQNISPALSSHRPRLVEFALGIGIALDRRNDKGEYIVLVGAKRGITKNNSVTKKKVA